MRTNIVSVETARREMGLPPSVPTRPLPPAVVAPVALDVEIMPSTDEAKLNKLERDWLRVLRHRGVQQIGVQALTLKLGADLRYTPDFTGVEGGRLKVWECKGFMRDDGRVKLLAAARQWPMFDFVLVTREKGQWFEEDVKR